MSHARKSRGGQVGDNVDEVREPWINPLGDADAGSPFDLRTSIIIDPVDAQEVDDYQRHPQGYVCR